MLAFTEGHGRGLRNNEGLLVRSIGAQPIFVDTAGRPIREVEHVQASLRTFLGKLEEARATSQPDQKRAHCTNDGESLCDFMKKLVELVGTESMLSTSRVMNSLAENFPKWRAFLEELHKSNRIMCMDDLIFMI